MPTRAEGMGLPIHEAIDAGVPVICSDIEVLREHYDHRSRAIIWVDPECPAAIADALDDACDHADERRAAATDNSGSGRTWDDLAAATVEILRETIAGYDPAAPAVVSVPLPPAAAPSRFGTWRFRGLRRVCGKIAGKLGLSRA